MKLKHIVIFLVLFLTFIISFSLVNVADEPDVTAEIAGHNLAVQNNVCITYYVEINNPVPNGYEIILDVWEKSPDENVTSYSIDNITSLTTKCTLHDLEKNKIINSKEYHRFQLTDITAQDMTKTYYVIPYLLNLSTNAKTKCGSMDKYSILQYCIEMYDYEDSAFVHLLDSMLEYGASAQQFMGINTSRLANDYYALVYLQDATFGDEFNFEIIRLGQSYGSQIVLGEQLTVLTDNFYGVAKIESNINVQFDEVSSGVVTINANRTSAETKKLSKIYISTMSESSFSKKGSSSEVILSKYSGNENNVILADNYFDYIHASSSFSSNVLLTSIGLNAFKNNSSVKSVSLPDSVVTIDSYAFENCSSLSTITLSNNLTSIGTGAFSNCSSLESISIIAPLSSLATYTFSGCSNLIEIHLPSTIASVGSHCFQNVPNGLRVYFNGDWSNISSKFPADSVLNPSD